MPLTSAGCRRVAATGLRLTLGALIATLAAASPARAASGPKLPDYRARTMYFVVADRFHPSVPWSPYVDPRHPFATNTRDCFTRSCPLEEQWRRYWGGDIAGIVDRVGYLRRLGVSALWVTPLMQNVPGYVPSRVFQGWGAAYHGYWVENYDRVNPHFGDWASVRRLSRALHAAGIRYVQDITLNHSNPLDTHAHGHLLAGGVAPAALIHSYRHDHDAAGRRMYKHYQDTAQCQQAEQESDALWSWWQLHHCLLADLSGYDQRVPEIADYLLGGGRMWLDHGVDDFRLDAVKFPFPTFISAFTHQMAAHQAAVHRPAPYFVGEWSGGGVGDAKSLTFADHYRRFGTRILDFSLSRALNQFVGGAYEADVQQLDAGGLDELLHERVRAFHGADTWQGTFIDNHDQMRTLVRLQKLGVPAGPERRRRLDLATVLLMTVRGIPIVFYGDEQYLAHYHDGHDTPAEDVNSDDDDPFNRIGMRRWDETTPGFRIVRALARLRRGHPAVWKGAYRTLAADGDVLVFERRRGADRVVVAVNRGPATTRQVTNTGLRPGSRCTVLASTSRPNARSTGVAGSDGTVTLHLAHLGAVVCAG